ncbi:MAG: Flp family type IVb pilin [Caulobacterales bacterium]
MKLLRKLLKSDSGATAIEYGLIAALISVVIIGSVGAIGKSSVTTYDKVNAGFTPN